MEASTDTQGRPRQPPRGDPGAGASHCPTDHIPLQIGELSLDRLKLIFLDKLSKIDSGFCRNVPPAVNLNDNVSSD